MFKDITKVFIGSSSEGVRYANTLQVILSKYHTIEATVWNQNVFKGGQVIIHNLMQAVNKFDMAIFIFSPDDVTVFRGTEMNSVRDNIIFEMGLFLSKLGLGKVFAAIPQNTDIKVPSDLFGINFLYFNEKRYDGNLKAALNDIAVEIDSIISDDNNLNQSSENDINEIVNTIKYWQEKENFDTVHKNINMLEILYKFRIANYQEYLYSNILSAFISLYGFSYMSNISVNTLILWDIEMIMAKHKMLFYLKSQDENTVGDKLFYNKFKGVNDDLDYLDWQVYYTDSDGNFLKYIDYIPKIESQINILYKKINYNLIK